MTDYQTNGGKIYLLEGHITMILQFNQNYPLPASQVAISGSNIYVLIVDSGGNLTRVKKIDTNGNTLNELTYPITYTKMSLSPNNLKLLVWDSSTTIKIINLSVFADEYTYTSTFSPSTNT